ncbi:MULTISPECIES: hypothetical protein [Dehalobacter]|jgi:hypothetical protein|nr:MULTISPECIES: hypothetical protein [Dehalobacter]
MENYQLTDSLEELKKVLIEKNNMPAPMAEGIIKVMMTMLVIV